MKRLIIFDLDGTLINSIFDLADAVNDSLSELGYPTHDTDKYYKFVGNGSVKLIERALPEHHRSAEDIAQLHTLFSVKYQSCCLNKTAPYNGITNVLGKLKASGIKLAVASNKPDKFTKFIIDNIFGAETFDCILGKRDGFPTKPDPQIIYDILKATGITDRNEALVVGDSDVDVLTAHNAGIECIGCDWGFRGEQELKEAGTDYLAFEPNDIIDIVKADQF